MDGISRSRGWDKEIPHVVLPMEQLVLSDKWARKTDLLIGTRKVCTNCLQLRIHVKNKTYYGNSIEPFPQNCTWASTTFEEGPLMCIHAFIQV